MDGIWMDGTGIALYCLSLCQLLIKQDMRMDGVLKELITANFQLKWKCYAKYILTRTATFWLWSIALLLVWPEVR